MPKSLSSAQRLPLHQRRLRLTDEDPNYRYYWALGIPERIEELQEDGYEFVTTDKKSVDKAGDVIPGNVRRAGKLVLMRCKRDDYEARVATQRLESARKLRAPIEAFKNKAASMQPKPFQVVDQMSEQQGGTPE